MDLSLLRPGDTVENLCRGCKMEREHIVIAAAVADKPPRVRCNTCGSEHNFRRAGSAASTSLASGSRDPEPPEIPEEHRELADVLRQVMREELGLTPVEMAPRFEGGELILRPGRPGTREKVLPIETFFSKIIALRNRLRVLEQQVNASAELSGASKLKLQGYITACYGSLTSFNVLFREEEDRFIGRRGNSD